MSRFLRGRIHAGQRLHWQPGSPCFPCAVTCATNGFANVPLGNVVRKLHNYECTRDMACERACPTKAIRLQNL